ncbi:MAG: thioesterase family protein [Gemmatimonadota bacterium]|nr:thioesterase family protein [Gemmatimonadota bacterium]
MSRDSLISEISHRVNYSEIDQMGVVYHSRYVVWLDEARTEHIRRTGVSYRDLEAKGIRLVVGELRVRYRQPARYDDLVQIRCWVRECASRRITFGYAVYRDDELLITAETAMMALNDSYAPSRLPDEVMALLPESPDPVRI